MMSCCQFSSESDAEEYRYSQKLKKEERQLKRQPKKVQEIYHKIYEFSGDLSDGFEYYGGHDSVLKLAKEISKL